MAGSLYTIVIVAQVTVGGLWHRERGPGCCDACGAETARIREEIATLQACPRWRARDDAAHALRRFDWRCHPEIVAALATALARDCEEEVREEAAEALAKLAPCLPVAHEALQRAAACDPDSTTRKEARKALDRLNRRCIADCRLCGPVVGRVAFPAAVPVPVPVPITEPIPGPGPQPVSPTYGIPPDAAPIEELPPPLPGPSPFVLPPSATRPRLPALAEVPRPAPPLRRPPGVLFLIGRRPLPEGGR
ncbi:MAG TPA: HEAT repeat domain-containing protein [Isosphaeraceae bacterium]